MGFGPDLHLQLRDSSLQAQELLLEGGLFSFEGGDLLLNPAVLCLLEIEVSFPKLERSTSPPQS